MDNSCGCFSQENTNHGSIPSVHNERQNTNCESWHKLLELVDSAKKTGVEEFAPFREMTPAERGDIVTLPPSIDQLASVRRFDVYGTCLVRIPPEIGQMESLEIFAPYTSYALHWFPYELTHCPRLSFVCVSTRAIYGNYKYRPPFPCIYDLADSDAADLVTSEKCSVCDSSLDNGVVIRRWISLQVANNVLPLLVNACSMSCLENLPETPSHYAIGPHEGGPNVFQPPPRE